MGPLVKARFDKGGRQSRGSAGPRRVGFTIAGDFWGSRRISLFRSRSCFSPKFVMRTKKNQNRPFGHVPTSQTGTSVRYLKSQYVIIPLKCSPNCNFGQKSNDMCVCNSIPLKKANKFWHYCADDKNRTVTPRSPILRLEIEKVYHIHANLKAAGAFGEADI